MVYTRTPCKVRLNGSDDVIDAQIYFNDNIPLDGCELVESGDFRQSTRGKKYDVVKVN